MSEKQILASCYAKRQCNYYHEKICDDIQCHSCAWYRLSMYEERKEAFIKGYETMKQRTTESICTCCPLNQNNCNCTDESRKDKVLGVYAATDGNCRFMQKLLEMI